MSSPTLAFVSLLHLSLIVSTKWYLTVVLLGRSLMPNDVDPLFVLWCVC